MAPLIELDGVGRSYEVGGARLAVLKGVTLRIDAGEFVAIMGPSGSGKSTLMQILGLLDRPTEGAYRLKGRDVSRLTDDEGARIRSREIGFVFQMFNLLARTEARENVALPLVYAGVPRAERLARAEAMLRLVGLGDRLDHAPNQLSGGQQQRVAVARALVTAPSIIFADEPTGNLASAQAEEVLGMLQGMNDAGITVVMVTHEPDIAQCAKRIVRIKDGLVVEDAPNPRRRVAAAHPLELPPLRRGREDSPGQWLEYGRSALRAIVSHKVRSGLSMLGILIGVAAVVAMMAIGTGARQSVERGLSSLGSNLIMLRPQSPRGAGGVRGGSGSYSRLTLEDAEAIRGAHPAIARVSAEVTGTVQAVYRDKNASTDLVGAQPNYSEMRGAKVYHGRFFTEAEEASSARVAVLGQTVVDALFGAEDPVGRTVKLDRVKFKVVGVLERKGASTFRDQDDVAIVPLRTAMKRVLGRQYLGMISIEAASPESIPPVIAAVTSLMRKRERLPEYKEDTFRITDMTEIQAAVTGTSKAVNLLIVIVGAIAMVVGGIGIMNIMLVSVSERTREIGLRKAIGATRSAVLAQFLIEAVAVSVLGGLLGIAFGWSVAQGLSSLAGWAAPVTAAAVAGAFLFSAGVGVVFGWWPARMASRLSPIEALRYE